MYTSLSSAMDLRLKMVDTLREYADKKGMLRLNQDEVAQLFGKSDYVHLMSAFTDEDRQLCEVLCGPHGYSIYRALLIKRSSQKPGD